MSPDVQASVQHDRGTWARRHNQALVSLARRVWQDDCTLEDAFGLICETAAETLEVERVNIWRHDPAAGRLTCLHHYERSRDRHSRPCGLELRVDGDYGEALGEVRVINLASVERERDGNGLGDYLRRHGIGSLLDAPVRTAGELLGVICHEHVGPSRVWSPEDQAFAGSIGDYVAMAYEIDRRRRLEGRVRHLELFDPHTNLPNRDHLLDVVHAALRPMHGGESGPVAIHLHMDASPHEGDAGHGLLVDAAARLRGELDGSATLARVRGNAFAVLPHRHLPETAALDLAERCIDLVQTQLDASGTATIVTAGIAFARDLSSPSADNLLRNAETASLSARNSRLHRCEVFNAGQHRDLVARIRAERALREAFAAGELEVHFQPEVELASGRWTAAEALLRWRDGNGGYRPACEFIDIIEGCGLILPIGRWMLHEACRQALEWPAPEGATAPRLRVNLSARQFAHAGLVDDIRDALSESRLPAERLCVELTESALLPDIDIAVRTLTRLRELGICIALDDFGTGYSSLSYLKRLPIDVLKLDRSFIAGLPDDPHDMAIVQAITGLARCTGLRVVAEGVETEAQARALRECGVERAQGYLFSKAIDNQRLRQGFGGDGS